MDFIQVDLIVMPSTLTIAGSKSQQFTIPNIDRIFDFYKPKPPLSDFVDNFWLYEGNQTEPKTERILPTGTLELAINLLQNELRFYDSEHPNNYSRLSGAVVSGASGHGFTPDAEEEVFIVGVHFKPGGAFPFLGLPAGDLADTHVDLETLWGPSSARRLRESLCEAQTSAERFQLLQESLLSRLYHDVEKHYAVSAALEMFAKNQPGPTVREAAKDLGLSQRRFIQVFQGGSWPDAKTVQSDSAVSADSKFHPAKPLTKLGGSCPGFRILRSVTSDTRVSRVLRPQSDRLSNSAQKVHRTSSFLIRSILSNTEYRVWRHDVGMENGMMRKRNPILVGVIAAYAACVLAVASCAKSPLTLNKPMARTSAVVSVRYGFFADPMNGAITTGRARSLVVGVVGLISVIIGGLALARNGRTGAVVGSALGLIAMILSVVHLGTTTGGFGTGSGRAGAIVALVLGLIGVSLGGLVLARSRRSRSIE